MDGFDKALELINEVDIENKGYWKILFYWFKGKRKPVRDDISVIENLYAKAESEEPLFNLEFLMEYQSENRGNDK